MLLPAPSLVWTAYRCPKAGHSDAECEDAYAADTTAGRFALADGASESAFAREWAEGVAGAYVTHRGRWSAWLPATRDHWQRRFQSEAMPWYVEAKFLDGAFATLLGLTVRRSAAGRLLWRSQAVGDSCLFQVRDDRIYRAFPVKRSADFDSRPALLGSRPSPPHSPRCRRFRARGGWRPDDIFLLMTDALAQWFLKEIESGSDPWARLKAVDSPEAFAALAVESRAAGRMRNDDSTLVRIQADRTMHT
jgi:hypothetical protein